MKIAVSGIWYVGLTNAEETYAVLILCSVQYLWTKYRKRLFWYINRFFLV